MPARLKQLVVLSGKGGTGKTSLSAALAHLSAGPTSAVRAVFADADVDAANLSLTLQPQSSTAHEFWGGLLARIAPALCSGCGTCATVCRFDAVLASPTYHIDPLACEGCAACVYACPQDAIHMAPQQEGVWFRSETHHGTLFHAELNPGGENSGKLVTLVKQQARLWAEETQAGLVIVDGPPGIGCPVISACAGADLGLIVSEPGLAGLHDLQRVLGVLQHFHVPAVVCINKADLSPSGSRQIRDFAAGQGLAVIGEIPFDEHIPQAMLAGLPISEVFPAAPAACAIRQMWGQLLGRLFPQEG